MKIQLLSDIIISQIINKDQLLDVKDPVSVTSEYSSDFYEKISPLFE